MILALWAMVCLLACSPLKQSLKNIGDNPVFIDSFTGFVLFDPEDNKILFEHQGSRYFTPASNTKLFTFYVANRILGDSIPAFEYKISGDSIWLWGTGDPSFLHPDLPASLVYEFLKGKNIFLIRDRHAEPIYGPGWAWDDYKDSYQREKTTYPIYGNALRLGWDSLSNKPLVTPQIFQDRVTFEAEETDRLRGINEFFVSNDWDHTDLDIPFNTSDSLFASLWSDTLKSNVKWLDFLEPDEVNLLHSIPADSIYQRVLQKSDNFLAEQLILLSSWKLFGELNSNRTIELLTDSLLSDLPHPPIWVDGSGLSRYNMFTPLSIVALLNRIYREVDEERIFALFPAGGQSGTIEGLYHANPPYIFAKTGTLRNNHALSGYLVAKSGKRLIFSFMHNHYAGESSPIKKEMERLLWQIHLDY